MDQPSTTPTPPLPWRTALALGVPATAIALALMFWARSAYQIRTLPERVMEWSLQFIPLDLFEQGLQKFGTSAKEIALIGNYLGLALTLLVLGAVALRGGARLIVGISAGLWLLAMIVIMPITGAGFFASNLPQDVLLTDASYLGLALAYGTVLLLTHSLATSGTATAAAATGSVESRRAFIGALVGTGAAYALTFWFGRNAGTSNSTIPLASVGNLPTAVPTDTAVAAIPTQVPTATAAPVAGAATPTVVAQANGALPTATTALPATPTVAPTATPLNGIPPRPSPAQAVTRDKDGSLTASTRANGELAAQFTPSNGFYITTKNAGGDPIIDPDKWRLVLDGEVVSPVQLDPPLLYKLPSVQIVKTLECISNWVNKCEQVPFGCGLIGNAMWKGVRLTDVLAVAGGLKPGVVGIVTLAADEFNSFIPADPTLLHDTLLVYEMNGQVLPLEHGYPARLLVPGRYGMKSPKFVIGIRPTKTVTLDWYGRLGWSKDGIIQAMTRIDVPANNASLPAGSQKIAGIAYGGANGVSKVEFSADGGQNWSKAEFLEDPPAKDVWARWQGTFTMPASGTLTLAARCVDGNGTPQNTNYTITQPNGGTGLNTAVVKAA
jgi:DMSO/TMAO reductase YedYZ molybdopterin-dependent catalytic subunit